MQNICYSTLSSDYKHLFSKRLLFKFNLQYLHCFWRNYDVSSWFNLQIKIRSNKLELLQSQAPAEGVLRGVECSRARSMEHGAWSMEHGARSKEYGVRNEQWGIMTEEFSIKYFEIFLRIFKKYLEKIFWKFQKIFRKFWKNYLNNISNSFEKFFNKYF